MKRKANVLLPHPLAEFCQFVCTFIQLVMQVGIIGMRRVGHQISRHAIHRDLMLHKIVENCTQVDQAYA